MPVTITLTKGYSAIVDDEDAHLAAKKWHAVITPGGKVYAASSYGGKKGQRVRKKLHQVIMNATSGLVVDHFDGDTMNNRRSNLRVVTQSINLLNKKGGRGKGYRYDKENKRWFMRIMWQCKTLFLGRVETEDDARDVVAWAREALESGEDPAIVAGLARADAWRKHIGFPTPEEAEAAKAKAA